MSELEQNTNFNIYADSVLGLSFSYPAKYHKMSLAADADDEEWLKSGFIFFIAERNKETEESIQYYIDCHADKSVGGVCREHMIDDIDVFMENYDSYDDFEYEITYLEEECEASSNCDIEIINDNKTLVSKQTQVSNNPRDIGMRYKIILSGDNPSYIQISTRKPIEFSDIIKAIIDSAENTN